MWFIIAIQIFIYCIFALALIIVIAHSWKQFLEETFKRKEKNKNV